MRQAGTPPKGAWPKGSWPRGAEPKGSGPKGSGPRGAEPRGAWTGNPLGGVKAPQAIVLPDPDTRFLRTAVRLQALSAEHPMIEWLRFMARLSQAQHTAATTPRPLVSSTPAVSRPAALHETAPTPRVMAGLGPATHDFSPPPPQSQTAVDQAVEARMPPLADDVTHRNSAWRDGLAILLDDLRDTTIPEPARAVVANLRSRHGDAVDALADGFLHGTLNHEDAGAALYVAAALQVYFTRLAATLPSASLRLLPQRSQCPCCGSTPVCGVVTASGQTPGTRYLYCSLCSTAWNHVRAVCITCGGTRSLSLRGVEGDSGAVKAETCDECHSYAKILYQSRDMQLDPFADDLATLGLDLLVAEAGWARHAPNPFLLAG